MRWSAWLQKKTDFPTGNRILIALFSFYLACWFSALAIMQIAVRWLSFAGCCFIVAIQHTVKRIKILPAIYGKQTAMELFSLFMLTAYSQSVCWQSGLIQLNMIAGFIKPVACVWCGMLYLPPVWTETVANWLANHRSVFNRYGALKPFPADVDAANLSCAKSPNTVAIRLECSARHTRHFCPGFLFITGHVPLGQQLAHLPNAVPW